MSPDEYASLWNMIGNLWNRDIEEGTMVAAWELFQELRFDDARIAVKDLFARGLDHPPSASQVFAQTKDVAIRRARQEALEDADRKDRALPAQKDTLRAFAAVNNGYTPTQVFRNAVGPFDEDPAFPEFHDPAEGVPYLVKNTETLPDGIVRDSKEAALPVSDRADQVDRR